MGFHRNSHSGSVMVRCEHTCAPSVVPAGAHTSAKWSSVPWPGNVLLSYEQHRQQSQVCWPLQCQAQAHRAEESMPAVPSGGVDTLSLEVFGASGEGLGIKGCWLFINLGKRIRRKLLIEERIALQDKL